MVSKIKNFKSALLLCHLIFTLSLEFVMEVSVSMNRELYNILINGNYFTHSIGKIYDKDIFTKLESILKLGAIYSKDSLRKEGRVSGNIRITKDSNVSLFDPSGYNLERRMLSPKFSTFFPISIEDIIFLVDNSVEFYEGAKRSDFDYHEITVKNKVPFDYIFGIIIPNSENVKDIVAELFERYNIDLIVYDFDGNELDINKKGR